MQVDPVKPKLKPPGTKHLIQNCDILLSTSAFKFNLRRYNEGDNESDTVGAVEGTAKKLADVAASLVAMVRMVRLEHEAAAEFEAGAALAAAKVGRCRLKPAESPRVESVSPS